MLAMINKKLMATKKNVFLLIPYAQGDILNSLYKNAKVVKVEYEDDFIKVEATVDNIVYAKVKKYLV